MRLRGGWRRVGVVVAGVAAAVLGVAVAAPVSSASDGSCAESATVFGVDSAAGHLVELGVCLSDPGFTTAVPVDDRDWRGYTQFTAVRDGSATVLYAVTSGGQLLWHRQESAGAAFGDAKPVAPAVDWSQATVFAPQPGYLHAGGWRQPLRTFRHDAWASGGTDLVEEQRLLHDLPTSGLTAATWGGHIEVNEDGRHLRGYRANMWHDGGPLPPLLDIAGREPWLYGVELPGRTIALLRQPSGRRAPWEIAARSAATFSRVIVPVAQTFAGPPVLGAAPPAGCRGHEPCPWEWQ